MRPDQHSNFTLSITGLLSLLLLIFPCSLFSQDSSPPSPDFNDDGIVNLLDYGLFRAQWDTRAGGPNWDAKYDLHSDGVINLLDYALFVSYWGQRVRSTPGESPPQQEVIPQVTITAGTSPVTEGTAATFTITVSPAPTSALTVNVDISEDGDVISGTASSTVIINANATTDTLTVNTDNDEADESNSVVTAEVESGTGYTVGSSSSARVTVEDNDDPAPPPSTPPPPPGNSPDPPNVIVNDNDNPPPTPEVTISADSTPVTEGTSATFTITASSAPATALTVSVNVTEDGAVISGTAPSTVIINANNTSATLTVNTDNDNADESNSVITAEVQSGTGYTVGSSSSASVTVEDNDVPEVTISAGTTPVTEGTAATFTLSVSPAPATALTVSVNVTEDGDVISGTAPSTVIINANNTTATLTVNTQNDEADEPNSVVTAEVQTGTGYTVGSSSSARVTVNDNDVPEVTISAGTTPVTEGTAATFTLNVSPTPATALTVSVNVTEDGDVISGTAPSTVIINANNTTATLTVNTQNDEADEPNSVVTAEVQSGTGYTVGSSSSARVTVEDNDVPEVTISAGTTPVTEGTAATFTISVSPAPATALTVSVNVSETGDMISGTAPLSVTIDATKTTATLKVATDNDNADESNSVITAEVQSGSGYTVGSTSSASVTVEDNENPDLEVGTPTVSDTSPVTGGTFTLSASVSNTGDGESAATTLRYYQSTDATITTDDTEVGTDAVGALSASGTSAKSMSPTAPSEVGTYYYGACVDAVADESDTANNCSSAVQVDVEEPKPNLQVSRQKVDWTNPVTGETFTLSAIVWNESRVASTATTLRYYQSTDATITTDDTEVGTDAVGALSAYRSSSESISLTAPSEVGTYYYGACVDAVVDESDTTDNCSASVKVDVEAPARRVDISPRELTFKALGSTATVTVRILDENGEEDPDATISWIGASPIGRMCCDFERVDGGIKVTVNKNGTTQLSISSEGAQSATLQVTAYQEPASLEVSPNLVSLAVGETATLSATIKDANGNAIEIGPIYWETSSSEVVTVEGATKSEDANTGGTATVTAVAAGTATVKARHFDVSGTATVTVTGN